MNRTPAYRWIAGVAVLGVAAALAACAPGSNNDSTDTSAPGAAVSTDISKVGDVTLKVWDQETRGGQNDQISKLNDAFHAKYPNVTIDRKNMSTDDLNTTLPLSLTGTDVPDVTQANNARKDMGAYVKAGQLTDLTPYAQAYGWDKRYSQSVLRYSSYSADGKTFGSGNVYGLPQMGEVVGVFYSKAKLAKIGVGVPTSWAEFGADLAAAKAKGETALILGNLDKWPGLHVFGPVQGAHVPSDQIVKLGFGQSGASWTTPENVAAAKEIQDWSKAGYFNKSPNGTDYDKAWQNFAKGEGVFLIAGNWLAADLGKAEAMGDDVGFFAPPVADGAKYASTGGTSLPWAIPSGSKNKDVAAAYIDFITSDDAMKTVAEAGNLPINHASELVSGTGVQADVAKAFEEVTTEGTLLPYLDYPTPTFADTIEASLQQLLDSKITPEKFTENCEADYSAFVKENG